MEAVGIFIPAEMNTHLDYSLHPKLALQRKLNIIVYLNNNWQPDWGGQLGLWGNESSEALATSLPKSNLSLIEPLFLTRLVIVGMDCLILLCAQIPSIAKV